MIYLSRIINEILKYICIINQKAEIVNRRCGEYGFLRHFNKNSMKNGKERMTEWKLNLLLSLSMARSIRS